MLGHTGILMALPHVLSRGAISCCSRVSCNTVPFAVPQVISVSASFSSQ